MTYGEFKQLAYPDSWPMEYVLTQALLDGKIDILSVNNAYAKALETEKHTRKMRFEEACVNLTQILSGNYKGKDLKEVKQRAIHTLNMSETLPHNIYNKEYDYTDEDKKKWDEFCEMIYGTNLNGTR